MIVVLSPDDPRIGTKDNDGAITKWPDVDLNERGYLHINATIRMISKTQFVIIPTDKDGETEVTLSSAPGFTRGSSANVDG
jgi:hypothetical protein